VKKIDSWITAECVGNRRISGGFNILLREFNRWLEERGVGGKALKCKPERFEELLMEREFPVQTICGVKLVMGLGLAEDWRRVHEE
jgi:hypothetical protein